MLCAPFKFTKKRTHKVGPICLQKNDVLEGVGGWGGGITVQEMTMSFFFLGLKSTLLARRVQPKRTQMEVQ